MVEVPERFPLPEKKVGPIGLGAMINAGFEVTDEELAEAARETTYIEPDDEWGSYTEQMMRSSCAFFAQEMLTGPMEPPYNGRFIISEHHVEWDDLIAQYHRICVLAPRDHGKCSRGDALIATPSGKRVRIDEWEGGELWAYNTKTHQFDAMRAPASRPNGVKRILRITTRSGRRVEVTENHPLRLWNEWQRADRIQVGDRIGVPYQIPSQATGEVLDAWLVGLLVGDGGLTGSNVILSTADPLVLASVKERCEVKHASKHDYRLLGLQKRMRQLGLMGKGAKEKRVPDEIFEANNIHVAGFLSGYLDADAHVNPHGGGSVEFYSVSEALLRDVQHLLSRLGVLSVLSVKRGRYREEEYLSWRLTVRGKDIVVLAKWLTPEGERAAQLQKLVEVQEDKAFASGACLDRFPVGVWNLLEHSGDWFRRHGHSRPNKIYEPTRDKVRRVAEAEGNQGLLALVDAPVLWDEVVSVEDLGEDETWSIHVPRHVNYLADDVINHNTFFFDFAYPLWKAFYIPRGRGFIFSATKEQAERILADIVAELEGNPKLRWLIPDKKEVWRSTQIRLSNGHTIYARGFGTRVRGAHPDWIVVDDGLNDETAYSDVTREKENNYFFNAITNMIKPTGQIIVVGTPFHQADLYAELAENEEYEFRRYQAMNEDTDEALWPERYSKELLEARKREIGPIRFNREFQTVPIADDMSLFPTYLFKGEPVEQPTIKLGMDKEFWDDAGIRGVFMGCDFALSSSVAADFTVIWTMGLDDYGNRWLMDIQREKGMAYQDQLSIINTIGKKYGASLIYVEANQAQRIFGDELIRTTDLPIKQFVTGAQKNTLDKGVPSLRVLLENRKFRIPRGDAESIKQTDIWINEMRAITFNKGKLVSVAVHDDTAMACWICDQACRMGAFSFSFDDEEYTPGQKRPNVDEVLDLDDKESSDDDGDDSGNGASGNLIDMDLPMAQIPIMRRI